MRANLIFLRRNVHGSKTKQTLATNQPVPSLERYKNNNTRK